MKKHRIIIPVFFSAILFLAGCSGDISKSIIKKYEVLPYSGMATILIRTDGPRVMDTVYFIEGIAIYEQDKYDGEIGWLYATDVDRNMVHYVILEKGTITITATRDSLIFITGTPNNDAFFALDEEIEPLRMKMKTKGYEVKELRDKGENEKADSVQNEILEISKIWWGKQKDFAWNNTNMAGLNYVNKLLSRFTTDELEILLENYKNLSDKSAYQKVVRRYNSEMRTGIGVNAPDFTLVTDKGEMLSLTETDGRLTIIDFWASWCKPCRAENPNLISLYGKWKDKGLEIISVSIDKAEDKEKWLEAIKEDKLTWLQAWDKDGTAKKDYGITSIPRTFLIDGTGAIVTKDLRGEELNEFVEDFFGKEHLN